jgi:hypothetical protein
MLYDIVIFSTINLLGLTLHKEFRIYCIASLFYTIFTYKHSFGNIEL